MPITVCPRLESMSANPMNSNNTRDQLGTDDLLEKLESPRRYTHSISTASSSSVAEERRKSPCFSDASRPADISDGHDKCSYGFWCVNGWD